MTTPLRACFRAVPLVILLAVVAAPSASAGLAQAGGDRQVEYPTADGKTLNGTWSGEGGTLVVLSHMRPDSGQSDWAFYAERLAERGYRTFRFDFRGYGKSSGAQDYRKTDVDLRATLDYVKREGATDIVLIGASMGAMASAKLAAAEPVRAAVLMAPYYDNATFVGPTSADIRAIASPLLFITARGDSSAKDTRRMYDEATADKQLEVFPGRKHGRRLLKGKHADECDALIMDFLAANAPPTAATN